MSLPVLDLTRCTGSGECVAACPTACLEMKSGQAWLPRPKDCVSCGICEMVCPVDAVKVE
jgi:NAD-dependent dihydropyrimidine dehydrogenase PreA subunit